MRPVKFRQVALWITILGCLFLIAIEVVAKETSDANQEKSEVKRVIDQMERYYEARKVSRFMSLFSWKKFPNLISFKQAVENDFNMNRDIRLRRTSERLTVSKNMAVDQAMWQKQYLPMVISPHGGSRMKRIRGPVRIYLEKEGRRWKIINIQGYPIFGL
jgi:hypothetical protein